MPFDGAFSPVHWLIVATVALLVLGPDQLPRAGREAARVFRMARDARTSLFDELSNIFGDGSASEPQPEPVPEAESVAPAARDEIEAPVAWRTPGVSR